ncbi:hypothetical protein ABWH96_15080 [Marivirga tractuosa]|uniref:hypothetical protein n=1 Tax=Marivirga tractuosa TaxID=1006 RepID=UPI0035CF912B
MKLSFILMLICFQLSAQKYGIAVGLRIGDARYGLSVKQRILPRFSAEAITDLESDAYNFAVIPKYHLPITGQGFNLFFGAGIHVGGLKEYGSTYGYDLMGGIEWKIPAVPLVISADIKPAYHINHKDWFEFPATVSIHYAITRETKAKRKKDRIKRKRRKERRDRREERREKRQEWWDDFRNN